MRKKLWGLGMATVMLTSIALTGCGSNDSASEPKSSRATGAQLQKLRVRNQR